MLKSQALDKQFFLSVTNPHGPPEELSFLQQIQLYFGESKRNWLIVLACHQNEGFLLSSAVMDMTAMDKPLISICIANCCYRSSVERKC